VPDALAAALGRGGADGKLVIIKKGGDAFAVKEWLAADAHARTTADSRKPKPNTRDATPDD